MQTIDAAQYIPQAPPMVMVGHVLTADETTMTTSFQVLADNVLVSDGHLSEGGLIENIAQTAAAHRGYNQDKSGEALVGYIGALKDVKIHALPKVGDTIETTIEVTNEVLGATVIAGKTFCDSKLLAECEMRIFMKQHLQQ